MELLYQICGDILKTGFQGHVMRFMGKKKVAEIKQIHGGGMKS